MKTATPATAAAKRLPARRSEFTEAFVGGDPPRRGNVPVQRPWIAIRHGADPSRRQQPRPLPRPRPRKPAGIDPEANAPTRTPIRATQRGHSGRCAARLPPETGEEAGAADGNPEAGPAIGNPQGMRRGSSWKEGRRSTRRPRNEVIGSRTSSPAPNSSSSWNNVHVHSADSPG